MSKIKIDEKTSELLITIVADKEKWNEIQKNSFVTLKNNLEIKGFRKGKVPSHIAKQNINDSDVLSKSIRPMLDILVKEASKEIKKDLTILDSPTYKIEKISNVELEVTFIYPLYPKVELPDYLNIGTKYKEPIFDNSKIEKQIIEMQKTKSKLEDKKENSLENGDIAIFDFEGFLENVPFENGKAKDYSLEIGSKKFIKGFEEQMVGMKLNEEKEIKVNFPKEYQMEKLRGKEATFKIKLNKIQTKVLPKLNDEFVKSLQIKEVENVEQFKKYLKDLLIKEEQHKSKMQFKNEIFSKLIKETKIIIPSTILVKEIETQKEKFENELKNQGLTIEKYLKTTGMKKESLMSEFKYISENRLKESFIFAEISKKEKIELKESDYEEEYKKLSKIYGQDIDSIKKLITKEQIQVPMMNDRVIDLLISKNKKN